MDGTSTTLAILAAMIGVIVLFRLWVRPPRNVGHADPPGVRSVVVFFGDDGELFADDRADDLLIGVRLFTQILDGLGTAGIDVHGRGRLLGAQAALCTVGPYRYNLVLERLEDRWVASVEWVPETAAQRRHVRLTQEAFAPLDSPALRRLLAALDDRLRSHPLLSDVRWYRKERWLEEDTSDPAERPLATT